MSMSNPDPLMGLDPPERPDFRRVGRGVPYVLGLDGKWKRMGRSSGSGKILDDESALVDWRIRKVMFGAAFRPDLCAAVSVLDQERDKKAIRDAAEDCVVTAKGDERKITGTAIHAMLDHVDLDHDWEPAPQFVEAVNAYRAACDAYGLVAEDVEVRCVNDEFGLAGTADRRYRTTRVLIPPDGQLVPIGSRVVGDTKTGQTLEYAAGSYSTQLAAYADSVRYDVETNEREPFDPPTYSDWGIIMHVTVDPPRCDVYWVNLNVGREGLKLARYVKAWRKRTDQIQPATVPLRVVHMEAPDEPSTTVEPPSATDVLPCATASPERANLEPVQPLPSTVDAPGDDAAHVPPEAATRPLAAAGDARVHTWLRGRVAAIKSHEAAVGVLMRRWPPGVPGLKHEGHTADELAAIEAVVDRVEAEFSISFGQSDPRIVVPQRPSWLPEKSDANTEALRVGLEMHPRRRLLAEWSRRALTGKLDHTIDDREALAHALYEWGMIGTETEWTDDDLTLMLDGSIRALGYKDGIDALGKCTGEDAEYLMRMAFDVAANKTILRYVGGKPVVFRESNENGEPT